MKTVWLDSGDAELLVQRKPGEWYIPLSNVNEATLRELGEAIKDALEPEPLVREVATARRNANHL